LVGKPEEKRPLGRPRCRYVDNIKMDYIKIGLGGVAKDRDNAAMNHLPTKVGTTLLAEAVAQSV
jgi:hypothetical protein